MSYSTFHKLSRLLSFLYRETSSYYFHNKYILTKKQTLENIFKFSKIEIALLLDNFRSENYQAVELTYSGVAQR